ncbi:MAG: rod shape-determining protein MreC [bacterium]
MKSWFFLRHRGLSVLIIVLVLSFLFLTHGVRVSQEKASLPKRLVMVVVAPLLRAIHGASASLTSFWDSYIDLREVRRQNLSLKEEVSRLKQEEMLLSEAKRENERLHRLLQMRDNVAVPTVAAMVIGKDPSNWFRSILIDKGAREGVSRDSAVLCPQGLVGRVIEVMEQTSRVQLITDPNCAVGALIQRTRVGGVVVGEVGPYCRLKFLPRDAEVSVGDLVLTSGLGGLTPKGIPIGLVTAVQKKENALFQEAHLAPKVDLFRIEEVLVLAKPPRPEIRWREE